MKQDYLSYQEIVTQLNDLVQSQVTGTLFLATKKNRSAQIMLEKGEIVYVYCYNKRGEEAIRLMTSIVAGSLRFTPSQRIGRKQDLPPTAAILDVLKNVGEDAKKEGNGGQHHAGHSKGAMGLTAGQKKMIESCLAEFIGPMAAIISEEYFASGRDLEGLLSSLATEIPSSDQALRFSSLVRDRLGL